jgi:O-acetylhomoserine/O-acetylserine sulfhydrylase-like pyridoxal-dependent enzyme
MTEAQGVERGILPTMLRLSVGIEDANDLIEDLLQAIGG